MDLSIYKPLSVTHGETEMDVTVAVFDYPDSSDPENEALSSSPESETEENSQPTSLKSMHTSLLLDRPIYQKHVFNWKLQENVPKIHDYLATESGLQTLSEPGIQLKHLTAESSPLDIFHEFFTVELLEYVCDETNRYAHQQSQLPVKEGTRRHCRPWTDITIDELEASLGLVILMSITRLPDIKSYWSTSHLLRVPIFPEVMPRDRFDDIISMLHFHNDELEFDSKDRLHKLGPVVSTILQKCKTAYKPHREVSVGESSWHCRGSYRRALNSNSRTKFGIKVYKACESTGNATGYTYSFRVLTEKDKKGAKLPSSSKMILQLASDLPGEGSILALNEGASKPGLFHQLHQNKINVVGRVMIREEDIPREIEDADLKDDEVIFRSTDDGLIALNWQSHDSYSRIRVSMLSTMHTSEAISTGIRGRNENRLKKPHCVIDYDRWKAGLFRSDELASSEQDSRNSMKWYKKLFFYLMDMCIVNSYCIYKDLGRAQSERKSRLWDFQRKLVEKIFESTTLPDYDIRRERHIRALNPLRLSGRHFPEPLRNEAGVKVWKRCVVCSRNKLRKESGTQCDQCRVPLCTMPCFKIYHTSPL